MQNWIDNPGRVSEDECLDMNGDREYNMHLNWKSHQKTVQGTGLEAMCVISRQQTLLKIFPCPDILLNDEFEKETSRHRGI